VLLIVLGIVGFSLLAVIWQFSCESDYIPCRMVALRNTLLETVPFSVVFVLLLLSLALANRDRLKSLVQGGIIAVVILLGLYNSQKYQPVSSKESFLPQNSLITALRAGPGRVFGFDDATIETNFGTLFHFYDPQYYHPLYIKRYGELVSFANNGTYPPPLLRSDVIITKRATVSANLAHRRQRLFALVGVDRLFYKKARLSTAVPPVWENQHWRITKNTHALPKAYFVDAVVAGESDKHILELLFSDSFNPATTAIIEQSPALPVHKAESSVQQSVILRKYEENSADLQIATTKSSFLVFSDNYYPGWKAVLDGNEIPVYRTNYTFRGVSIPAGNHTLRFTYEPASFFLGSLISAFSALSFLILFLYRKRGIVPPSR
jgi:hypothetical protein